MKDISHAFVVDMERAGIERMDGLGRKLDFHALRHTFATNLRGMVFRSVWRSGWDIWIFD